MKRLLQLLALKMETNFLEFLTHLFFEGEKKNSVKIKTLFSLQNSLWLTLQIEKYCGVDDFVTVLLVDIMVGSVFAIGHHGFFAFDFHYSNWKDETEFSSPECFSNVSCKTVFF